MIDLELSAQLCQAVREQAQDLVEARGSIQSHGLVG